LCGALLDERTRRQLCDAVPALKQVTPESLRETIRGIVGKTAESKLYTSSPATDLSAERATGVASLAPALAKYTVNLTERAANQQIDPVIGRDTEIRQCIDILTRRRQNNPIL